MGRIKVLLFISRVVRSNRYIRNTRISTLFSAFVTISWTWSRHDRFLLSVIPKCLWLSTSWIVESPKYMGSGVSLLFFSVTSIYSVFWGQKDSNHLSAQRFMASRSLLIIFVPVASSRKSITKSVVSSANKRILQPMFSTMSLINIKNRSGPSTEPWGTPAEIVPVCDVAFPMVTRCRLLVR